MLTTCLDFVEEPCEMLIGVFGCSVDCSGRQQTAAKHTSAPTRQKAWPHPLRNEVEHQLLHTQEDVGVDIHAYLEGERSVVEQRLWDSFWMYSKQVAVDL